MRSVRPNEVVSFDVVGYRMKDGSIRLGHAHLGEQVSEFPSELEFCGSVYRRDDTSRDGCCVSDGCCASTENTDVVRILWIRYDRRQPIGS